MSESLSFGAWLKQRRRTLDLTQDELAQRIVCSLSTLRKIEADNLTPSKELAQLLAVALVWRLPTKTRLLPLAFSRLLNALQSQLAAEPWAAEEKLIQADAIRSL